MRQLNDEVTWNILDVFSHCQYIGFLALQYNMGPVHIGKYNIAS